MSELLRVENLKVTVDGKEILKGLDLVINKGETHVIIPTGPVSRHCFIRLWGILHIP